MSPAQLKGRACKRVNKRNEEVAAISVRAKIGRQNKNKNKNKPGARTEQMLNRDVKVMNMRWPSWCFLFTTELYKFALR
jgi:hypothetical protein